MEEILTSSEFQAHAVLALSGLTSAYIALARPTLSRENHGSASPPATLHEAGTSPALSSSRLALLRAALALYIFAMGATQLSRLGPYVFKFYTIWNWWLLGLYFALAAAASFRCARVEKEEGRAQTAAGTEKAAGVGGGGAAAAAAASVRANGRVAAVAADNQPTGTTASAAAAGLQEQEQRRQGGAAGGSRPTSSRRTSRLHAPGALSRACHALFLVNSATVIIVDAVCWGVLYPMLSRGPQSPEIERIIKRLLLTFTSYNQHGLNAVYIFADLLLNRQRLAFHAVGPLGLWSLVFALWAHAWHAATGKWLYPFLDTSKPWAPLAYFGLYMVHWLAFGIVALLYRVKAGLHARWAKADAKVAKVD